MNEDLVKNVYLWYYNIKKRKYYFGMNNKVFEVRSRYFKIDGLGNKENGVFRGLY